MKPPQTWSCRYKFSTYFTTLIKKVFTKILLTIRMKLKKKNKYCFYSDIILIIIILSYFKPQIEIIFVIVQVSLETMKSITLKS